MTDKVELTINEIVHSPSAQRVGMHLNDCDDTAKRKILETLQDTQHSIAVGTWVLAKEDTDEFCGCLLMDGVLHDTHFLESEVLWFDPKTFTPGKVCDENDIMRVLFTFYGIDVSEALEKDDNGYEDLIDRSLSEAAQAYDTFMREFGDRFMVITGYHRPNYKEMQYGFLNDEGRQMMQAIFAKYVTVPPQTPDAPTE